MIKAFLSMSIVLIDEEGNEFDIPYSELIPAIQDKMRETLEAAKALGLLDEVQIMADVVAEMMNAERSSVSPEMMRALIESAAVEVVT